MPLPDVPPEPPLSYAVPVEVRLSTERLTVLESPRMGMTGLHYLRPITPRVHGGVSVFGATLGDRGGFFGWGVSGVYRVGDGPWQAEAGLFVGGAGGSPGWVGGGLMLRPHAEVSHRWGAFKLGPGASQVGFPNGSTRSTQPFASLGWTSDVLFGPAGGGASTAAGDWLAQGVSRVPPTETAGVLARYSLRQSARRDCSCTSPSLQVGGLTFRRALPGSVAGAQPYWLLGAAGGLTQDYAGYAELMGGLGLQAALPLGLPLSLRIEAALGSGGAGAALDTGGGLLRKLSASLSWQVMPHLSLTALAGRVTSAGPFQAREARLELAWRGWDALPGGVGYTAIPNTAPAPATLGSAPLSLSAGWAQYGRIARDDGSQPGVGLALLKLERELDPHWRLLGQAGIATHGGAGGYATGQLGVGWRIGRLAETGWRVGGEASVGAAGGGAVKVADGLVVQAQAPARYSLSPHWALQADVGWLRSRRQGSLSSPLLGLSAVYSFSRLQGP